MKFHLKTLALAAALLLAAGSAFAGPTGSIATGDWNTAGTWNSGVPTDGTATGIAGGNTVTFLTGDSWSGGGWAAGLLIGQTGNPWSTGGAGTGTLNVTGGTMSTGYLAIGYDATGTMNVSGGTVTADQELLLGWQGATGSSLNVSGGTFNMAGAAASYNIGHGAAATFNVSGGTVNMNRTVSILNGSSVNVSGTGVMNINEYFTTGGAVNVSGGTMNFQRVGGSHFGLSTTAVMTLSGGQVNAVTDFHVGLKGSGTINQSGGTFSAGTNLLVLGEVSGTGIYNQSGGTLEVSAFGGSSGTAQYNFSGGTLKATGGLNLAAGGITTSITGTAGGSTINSNGNTVTVNAAQIALGASGVLTKTGAGSLTVNNDAGFSTGTWNVNGGSVDMVGYFNGANVNVAGGTLNMNRAGNHLSLSSTSTTTLSSGAINSTGDLNLGLAGNGTLNQSGGTLSVTGGVFWLGPNVGTGTYNQSGGSLEVQGILNGGGTAAYNFSGGTFKALANQDISLMALTGSGDRTINLNGKAVIHNGNMLAAGGSLTFDGPGTYTQAAGHLRAGNFATSSIILNSGTVNVGAGANDMYVGIGAGGNGTLTMNGGALNLAAGRSLIIASPIGGASTGIVNLNGGTLSTVDTDVTINSGGTLKLGGGTISLKGGLGYIANSGTYDVNGQTVAAGSYEASFFAGPNAKLTNSSASAATIVGYTGSAMKNTVWIASSGAIIETVGDLDIKSIITDGGSNNGFTKTGAGTLTISCPAGNTLGSGTAIVSAGTLIINGELTAGSVNVGSAGAIGGSSTIIGSLHLDANADFVFSLTNTLTVNGGSVTFDGLSIANIVGLDGNLVGNNTYTLIGGTATFDFTNVTDLGEVNKVGIGGGKFAYFQEGSLQVVVVPEPSTWVLLAIGLTVVVTLRRRRLA